MKDILELNEKISILDFICCHNHKNRALQLILLDLVEFILESQDEILSQERLTYFSKFS